MKSYTEEEVKALIDENLKLIKELTHTQEELEEESRLRRSAEKNYFNLCERCMKFYITDRDIVEDTIFVQAMAPRFMTKEDFNNGVAMHLINLCVSEREKHIFNATHISNCKEREDT